MGLFFSGSEEALSVRPVALLILGIKYSSRKSLWHVGRGKDRRYTRGFEFILDPYFSTLLNFFPEHPSLWPILQPPMSQLLFWKARVTKSGCHCHTGNSLRWSRKASNQAFVALSPLGEAPHAMPLPQTVQCNAQSINLFPLPLHPSSPSLHPHWKACVSGIRRPQLGRVLKQLRVSKPNGGNTGYSA